MRWSAVIAILACLLLALAGASCGEDSMPPTAVSSLTRTTPDNSSTQTFTWDAATDDSSGVAHYEVSEDSGTWTPIGDDTTYTTSCADGERTFAVRAIDGAGNTGDVATVGFTVDVLDPTSVPSLTKTTPDNDSTPTFTWNAAADDGSGFDYYAVRIDSGTWTTIGDVTTYTATPCGNGGHAFSVKAFDKAGNDGEVATVSFTVDVLDPTSVPSLTKTTRDNDNTPTFSWDAACDNTSGIARYAVSIDGTGWVDIGDATTYTCDTGLSEGEHSFAVKAFDKAGNEGAPVSTDFTVDTIPPVISQVDVSGMTVKWRTNEPATSQVEYGVTDSYGSTVSSEWTSASHSLLTSMGSTRGITYHFRVRSGDAAGNENVSGDYTFIAANLIEAQTQGFVDIVATGHGIQRIDLAMTSRSDAFLTLDILPGTIFGARSSGTQNIMVIESSVISLDPHESGQDSTLDAACVNMHLGTPTSSDNFALQTTRASGDLLKLVTITQFGQATFRVQQFAIWTITDNPARDAYTRLGTFGWGTGPSDDEMAAIRVLFEAAGIDTTKYKALV